MFVSSTEKYRLNLLLLIGSSLYMLHKSQWCKVWSEVTLVLPTVLSSSSKSSSCSRMTCLCSWTSSLLSSSAVREVSCAGCSGPWLEDPNKLSLHIFCQIKSHRILSYRHGGQDSRLHPKKKKSYLNRITSWKDLNKMNLAMRSDNYTSSKAWALSEFSRAAWSKAINKTPKVSLLQLSYKCRQGELHWPRVCS